MPLNPFGKRYREVRGLELALKTFERMAASPTTEENFSERYTFLKSVVILTWGGREVFRTFHPPIKSTLAEIEASLSEEKRGALQVNRAIDDLLKHLRSQLPEHTKAEIADWFMRW